MHLLEGKPPKTPNLPVERKVCLYVRKRNIIVKVHLNEAEREHLKEQVQISGFTTEQFLRRLIAGKEIKPRPPENMTELLRQLSAIGNNINQLTRVANTCKSVRQETLEQVLEMQAAIWRSIEEL